MSISDFLREYPYKVQRGHDRAVSYHTGHGTRERKCSGSAVIQAKNSQKLKTARNSSAVEELS